MDFFTVPTLKFGVLYCFFIIGHDRRKILHFNGTRNPNALWVVQQMREAWPYAPAHRFLWFDRDSKFGADVVSAVRDMGSQPTRTAFRSPWQNGVAERWVGSCRRDLLDHVIVLNERHWKRFMTEYVCATTMRIGLTSDSRKIRQPVGQPRHVLWWKARFTLALGSGACTIVTRPPLRLRQLRFIGTSLPVPVGTAGDAFAMGRARGLD
jgi:transposase InsO family protein